jgi:Protein of unknown function (DUF2911)
MKLRFAAAALFAIASFAVAHPHFPKTVEMRMGFEKDAPTIKVEHLTVTFNKDGFEKAKAGDTWHLAGAKFTAGLDVEIGGKTIAKGEYALMTRKTEKGEWELILDPEGKPFQRTASEKAIAIAAKFESGKPVQEHLRIDLQPSGDKENVALNLEVHFDQYAATARVATPAEK